MERQVWSAHLLPVPLSYWMGPEELSVPPAAELKSWRHIRDLRQADTKIVQQASRITANRDSCADFSKFGVLLENLHRYRPLHEARRECEATNAPTNNGDVTRADHLRCSPRYCLTTGHGCCSSSSTPSAAGEYPPAGRLPITNDGLTADRFRR
jgi:hypothetical protein